MRILVVDDHAPLVRLMEALLGRLGYEVDGFSSATEALRNFESDPRRYALAVVDLTMPDIPGEALALEMIRLNPSLRVLLCSGYPFDAAGLPQAVQPQFAVLQKPFLPNMLTKAVDALLRKRLEVRS